jgi:hypothetical protein
MEPDKLAGEPAAGSSTRQKNGIGLSQGSSWSWSLAALQCYFTTMFKSLVWFIMQASAQATLVINHGIFN